MPRPPDGIRRSPSSSGVAGPATTNLAQEASASAVGVEVGAAPTSSTRHMPPASASSSASPRTRATPSPAASSSAPSRGSTGNPRRPRTSPPGSPHRRPLGARTRVLVVGAAAPPPARRPSPSDLGLGLDRRLKIEGLRSSDLQIHFLPVLVQLPVCIMTRNAWAVLLILTCLWVCPLRSSGFSWNIFSSPSSSSTARERAPMMELDGAVADFAIDGPNDPRGVKLLENARNRVTGPKNCWHDAYRKLFASCGDIMADKEKQSRLAWHLCSCFQEDSGRPALPSCGEGSKMVHCRKRLSDSESKVFLEFFLETNTLCHQLQSEAFKQNTEKLINDLTSTSKSAEEKLEVIEERSEQIIKESSKLEDTLSLIEKQADDLSETSRSVGVQINDVLGHSKAIFERSKEIITSQEKLREGQKAMGEKMEAGMLRIKESYDSLGDGMDKLKEGAVSIQGEIRNVSESMSTKMEDLQRTASDIESVAGKSLENQKQLLDGQRVAMEGLSNLHSFQAKALEESRETVEKLAQFGQRQQEELLARQEQIREAHDHLIQNSHSILEAQEEFRAKQANIFSALDKLYILHNAILAESRFIKAFFFYCCVVFLIYMLTSAKQTFSIRGRLYFGLCVTLALEMGLIRIGADDFDKQFWVMSKVFLVRMVFFGLAIAQILHSIFTYRDYELLNHRLLQTLVEKVHALEENAGSRRALPYGTGESERSLMDYSWVFDEQLADEADSNMDPSYTLPPVRIRGRCASYVVAEEVGENSITTSGRYNLRPRK